MKAWLGEVAEVIAGVILWLGSYAWGAVLGAALICTPLLLAYLLSGILDGISATIALGAGVLGAYSLDLPPWTAEERSDLPLLIGGAAVSAVVFDLMRGSADVWTLVVALGLTVAGWPVRRALSRRGLTWNTE